MATGARVLVLDGDKVPALDIVRSLGRTGVAVTVGAAREDAIAFHSRFASARDIYPDPALDPAVFIEWLEGRILRDRYELVIPVTDLTVIPISRSFDRLKRLCALATESFDKLEIVCDKSQTLDVARRVGVPIPATVVVYHEDEVDAHAERLRFPVVCKPMASSVWASSGYVHLPVFYALDRHELRREVVKRLAACPVMLQEYRPGTGVGVEVLARRGEILQAFQHERLHELPLTGGGSTYRVSTPVDPVLREHARRLLAAVGWTGVAMVEFKVDRETGDATLMEINGRFWGSLALSSRAGMSFATDLHEMLTRGTTPPARAYVSGVRCRKLRDDVEWFKESVKLDARHRMVAAGLLQKTSRVALLGDLARVFSPMERYDVQMLADPIPGLVDLRDTAVVQLAALRRKAAGVWRNARSRWYRMRHAPRLMKRAGGADKLLFVCYGNIMRSPFASAYLHSRAAGQRRRVEATSAGLYERTGRFADDRAIAAGRQWGVDLSSHRSKTLDQRLVEWADLILVMDRPNLAGVRTRYPAAAGKTYLLGSFDAEGEPDIEIPDPSDGPYEAAESAYGRIAGAIDRLVATPSGSAQ